MFGKFNIVDMKLEEKSIWKKRQSNVKSKWSLFFVFDNVFATSEENLKDDHTRKVVTALIGPSGSGKSHLLHEILKNITEENTYRVVELASTPRDQVKLFLDNDDSVEEYPVKMSGNVKKIRSVKSKR